MPVALFDVECGEVQTEVDVGEWDKNADEQEVEVHESAGGEAARACADHEV